MLEMDVARVERHGQPPSGRIDTSEKGKHFTLIYSVGRTYDNVETETANLAESVNIN